MVSESESWLSKTVLLAVLLIMLAGCSSSGDSARAPSISITSPTAATSFSTVWTGVTIGGTISNAGFVHVANSLTGASTEGFVFYNQGQGTWFADVVGLGFGENPITATADVDGTGARTAEAFITLIRPLQPLDEIFNGLDPFTGNTHWIDESSFNQTHKIALFEDGTGRSTTGSVLGENAGIVTDFTWTKLSPDSVLITNCPACSFQKISRISGSIGVGAFNGQIETVGGGAETALHAFALVIGNL